MYYHASPVKGIAVLETHVSNHGEPLIYFSRKRENVLVYLSNAIEKYCRETGFAYTGKWTKWGPYGFTKEGLQQIDEYYPNALEDTYQGVSGYIYGAEPILDEAFPLQINDAAVSREPAAVVACEYVPDAYEAILDAEKAGRIAVLRYEESSKARLDWIARTIREEYEAAGPDYRHFIQGKFHILEG